MVAVALNPGRCALMARSDSLCAELLHAGVASEDMMPNMSLSTLSRWKIGGLADVVLTPSSTDRLAHAVATCTRLAIPYLVVGDCSNLLFADQGFRGVLIRVARNFHSILASGETDLIVGAGTWVPALVRHAISRGLGGIEHAIGIPGTFGGLCAMNGGSRRHGIGEAIVHADVIDRQGRTHRLSQSDLAFSYRKSRLQQGDLVMTAARLRLQPGDARALRHEAIAIMRDRRAKFPRNRANCGSVFVSNPALYDTLGPPGWAIEKAGLKGKRIGNVQFSPDHANFIVNLGGGRAVDVLALIALARQSVFDMSGIWMEAEIRYVDAAGDMRPAHLANDERGGAAE